MPWWGTVILTLGAALLAGGAGLGSAVMSNHGLRQREERIEAARRRERGADVIAPILIFIDDIEPVRVSFNRSSETPKQMQRLRMRWEELRQPLAAFAAGHPSAAVIEKSEQVITAVWNSFTSTSWVVHAITENMVPHGREDDESGQRDTLDTARKDHADARCVVNELLQLRRRAAAERHRYRTGA
jgi:hypothetical protein